MFAEIVANVVHHVIQRKRPPAAARLFGGFTYVCVDVGGAAGDTCSSVARKMQKRLAHLCKKNRNWGCSMANGEDVRMLPPPAEFCSPAPAIFGSKLHFFFLESRSSFSQFSFGLLMG